MENKILEQKKLISRGSLHDQLKMSKVLKRFFRVKKNKHFHKHQVRFYLLKIEYSSDFLEICLKKCETKRGRSTQKEYFEKKSIQEHLKFRVRSRVS